MLAGSLMNGGGITKRIVELSSKLVGHITGRLGHVTILASTLFASMSGSSAASCAAILAHRMDNSGSKAAPCPSGIGNTVLYPLITSSMNNNGI